MLFFPFSDLQSSKFFWFNFGFMYSFLCTVLFVSIWEQDMICIMLPFHLPLSFPPADYQKELQYIHFSIPMLVRVYDNKLLKKSFSKWIKEKPEENIFNNTIFKRRCYLLKSYVLVLCHVIIKSNLKSFSQILLTLISKYRSNIRSLIFYSAFFMLFQCIIITNGRIH